MLFIILFLLAFRSYGAEDTTSFSGIIPLLPKSCVNIPYRDCPLWCQDSIDDREPGQTLTIRNYPSNCNLDGFITKSGDVRVAMAERSNTKMSQVYRVLTFRRNSKGNWYQCRRQFQIWLLMRKGVLACNR